MKATHISKKIESNILTPDDCTEQNIKDFEKEYSVSISQLLYRGSEHNFSTKDFFNKFEDLDNTIVLVKTEDQRVICGHTP